ncbi:hypothetical protein ACFFQW_16905 [Umezawaea endophytica]|uniref:Uncharacterized protein n=1 Tax=Umezawaea endophytica TaxID=1654476 RepID=A0A9X2VQE5_9PSEU|nr:hypothetical protein [Umezawaea endophytica]MCS7480432.1 hypothetical protein [Umezawaea endophytica]
MLRVLGGIFLAASLGMCVWAQFVAFEGPPTCGGQPMRPGHVCLDLGGDSPTVTYDQAYAEQEATVGLKMLNGAVGPGAIGAITLIYACWRMISAHQFTVRAAMLHTLLFATAPLLTIAVIVQALASNLGFGWSSPIGVPGLTHGVLLAIVAVVGAAVTTYSRHEQIRAAEVRQRLGNPARAGRDDQS